MTDALAEICPPEFTYRGNYFVTKKREKKIKSTTTKLETADAALLLLS